MQSEQNPQQANGMRDTRKEECKNPVNEATDKNCQSLLPSDDKSIVKDGEFSKHRGKLIDRSKRLFWWRSISRVFNMISGMLIPAGIALMVAGMASPAGLVGGGLMAVKTIFPVATGSLTIRIGTDY